MTCVIPGGVTLRRAAGALPRGLAADGVALHAARVGRGVQQSVAAGDRADPAERPGGPDVDQVAAPAQFPDHGGKRRVVVFNVRIPITPRISV